LHSEYETYYRQGPLSGYSPSTIAWIGSIQAFAQFSVMIVGGPVTDRYGQMVREMCHTELKTDHRMAGLGIDSHLDDAHQSV
jgi:hypothetical protein